ncbi:hypothetical protein Aduo_019222 [Ancylostoma duodenale]
MSVWNREPELVGSARTRRAGLVFPVPRVHRQMRGRLFGRRVGLKASIFCAAVLEYLVAEVLEVSGYAAKDAKKKRIEPRHIFIAVRLDEDLNELTVGATFREGGVVPSTRKG